MRFLLVCALCIAWGQALAQTCPDPGDCWVKADRVAHPVWGTLSGYASQPSVTAGETLLFRISGPYQPEFSYSRSKPGDVNTVPDRTTAIQIFRLSGSNAILMTSASAAEHARTVIESPKAGAGGNPTDGYAAGFGWENSFALDVPDDWPSAVYYATLTSYVGGVWRIPFVVKAKPSNKAKILVIMPFATNNAYNAFGGKSLYRTNSSNRAASGAVSFERPGSTGIVSTAHGDATLISPGPEYLLARWVTSKEAELGKVDFATSTDLHGDASLTTGYRLVVLVGHDEYWSQQMRNNLEGFRAAGGNIAALSGNTMYWRVSFSASPTTGASNQVMKTAKNEHTDHFFNDDGGAEELALGVTSRVGMWYEGGSFTDYAYRVTGFGPEWVLADTGIGAGGLIGGGGLNMIGYETDGVPDKNDDGVLEPNDPLFANSYQLPAFTAPPNFSVIASRYISDAGVLPNGTRTGRPGNAAVTVWRDPHFAETDSRGWVFAGGSIWWSRCLWNAYLNVAQPPNTGQQVTLNVLRHLGSDAP